MTKRELQRRYAQQRQKAKAEYIAANGSPQGWKSSDDFKRIGRNQRQANYRYKRRVERVERQREVIEQKGAIGQTNLLVIQDWSPFHAVLGYGDTARSVIQSQFRTFNRQKDKETYLRVQFPPYPHGPARIYRTSYEADQGIKALYNTGMTIEEKADDSVAMLVAAVYGEGEQERFVNIYSIDITGRAGDFDLPPMPPSSI